MASTITNAFVTSFGDDVHHVFQRQGSMILNMLRRQTFQPGDKHRFFKMNTGSATQKQRHGEITPNNPQHGYVDVPLADWYSGDWVEEFDEPKISIDERSALVRSQAMALGRKADEIARDQAYSAAATDFLSNGGFTKYLSSAAQTVNNSLLITLRQQMVSANVPITDGRGFCIVGPKTWALMQGIDQFVNADYVDTEGLILPDGASGKKYLGINWFEWSGIQEDGSGDERNLLFHQSAFGMGSRGIEGSPNGVPLNPDWDWVGPRRSWFVSHGFEAGACVIDNTGTLEWVANT